MFVCNYFLMKLLYREILYIFQVAWKSERKNVSYIFDMTAFKKKFHNII